MYGPQFRLILLSAPLSALWIAVSAVGAMQGDYADVAAADLPKLSLNHYFSPAGKAAETKFVWTFAADGTFEAKAGDGAVPLELRQRLTGSDAEANQLTGKWKLEGGRILFSQIQADGQAVDPKTTASYRIYRTAPTVVRIGEPQYVFGIDPAAP